MVIRVPEYLVWHITNKRLKRLFKLVWRRIPMHDRAVLRYYLLDIYDDVEQPINVLGVTENIDTLAMFDGKIVNSNDRMSCDISLRNSIGIKSDLACMHVIAHELAHVVLRHNKYNGVLTYLERIKAFGKEKIDNFQILQEDTSDLLCWEWGFINEYYAFFEEFPEANKPMWFERLPQNDINENYF